MQVSDSNCELKITICSVIKNKQARVPAKNKSCVCWPLSKNNEDTIMKRVLIMKLYEKIATS